jgi:hypothetical protein
MKCQICGQSNRKSLWKCHDCGSKIEGGVVFVTGISGAQSEEYLTKVKNEALKHGHKVDVIDVGETMKRFAEEDDPDVQWDHILEAQESVVRNLRAQVFQDLVNKITSNPDTVFIVDLHLCFRWHPYLTKGFEPHILSKFMPYVRCFINLIPDISQVQDNLKETSWGSRKLVELLIWRDEELFLTDIFANICDRVCSFAVVSKEPPTLIERLIWHPEMKRVYLSFPITSILGNELLMNEIFSFRDRLRDFLVVFDPYASKDYDDTYKKPEMKAVRNEVGAVTKIRDFRFIDQANAIVVYFPKKVESKGVDAEMNHARNTGKPIYLYCPEEIKSGPFQVTPDHFFSNQDSLIQMLQETLVSI